MVGIYSIFDLESGFKVKKTIIAVFIASLFIITGCNTGTISYDVEEIYAFIGTTDNFKWQQVAWGLYAYGDKHDIKINTIEIDIENKLKRSVRQIRNSISNNTSAIIIMPFKSDEIENHLERAHDKGIPLIYLYERPDWDIPGTLVYTDNESAAEKAGQAMAKLLNMSGEVSVVGFCNTENEVDERKAGFIKAISKYPEMNLVNIYDCRGNIDIARHTVLDILAAYPNQEGIYTTCPQATVGAVKALSELGKEDVEIVAFDYDDEIMKYVNDEIISVVVGQNHYQIGYRAAEVAILLMSGESIPDTIDIDCDFISKVLEE